MENLIPPLGYRSRYSAKESLFAIPIELNDDSLETQIASALWSWDSAEHCERDAIASDPMLASIIEFWFPFSDIELTRKHNIWCDGIPLLKIESLGRVSFRMAGVGYFPIYFAPFELDFLFCNRRDTLPQSVICRFGSLDSHGRLQLTAKNKHPPYILDTRPKVNADWAVAVELTETENAE